MNLDKAIKTRKSVRRYSHKKPNWRKIIRAIDYARYAPMAGNMFSLKFILVQQEEIIEKLAESCQQPYVGKAPFVLVVVNDDVRVKRSYDERGERYARQQAGAAIQNVLLALNSLGMATCWTGAFVDEQIKGILKIPDDFTVEALLPIGIETKIPTHLKDKTELENILYFDKFKNRYMKKLTIVGVEGS